MAIALLMMALLTYILLDAPGTIPADGSNLNHSPDKISTALND